MKRRTMVFIVVLIVAVSAATLVMPSVPDYDYEYDTGFEDGTYDLIEGSVGVRPSDPDRVFPSKSYDESREYLTASEAEDLGEEYASDLWYGLNSYRNDAEDIAELILDYEYRFDTLGDMYSWVTLDYNKYPDEMRDEYLAWSNALYPFTSVDSYITDALDGSNRYAIIGALEILGRDLADYADVDSGPRVDWDAVNKLRSKESSLESDYHELMGAALTSESAYSIYSEAVGVFIELVEVRNDIAKLRGYSNYMELAYEVTHERDCDVGDADVLYRVLDEIDLIDEAADSAAFGGDHIFESGSTSFYQMDDELILGYISPFLEDMDPVMRDLLIHMYQYGLIHMDEIDGQIEWAYASRLDAPGGALIYMNGDRGGKMTSMVHEFGHAANMSLNSESSNCTDVKEIHSQGLESLYGSYLRGKADGGYALDMDILDDHMSTIRTAVYYTTFEEWAYITEASGVRLTEEMVVDRYAEINDRYHADVSGIDMGYQFVDIHHLFDAPGYYLSYAISAINAVELWNMAFVDYDDAKSIYLDLLYQGYTEGYSNSVTSVGLSDVLEGDNAESILQDTIGILERY